MTHPSTHHELSQLALQPAAGLNESAVASQFAQLFVLVSQLKEETEAQRSSIARLSSENTSLKQEVALLKRNERNQDSVVAEISRMGVPQGHWIYEEGVRGREDVEGIWSWSLVRCLVSLTSPTRTASPQAHLDSF
ncbi:hypothetical protein BDY24DRAFT_93903 [Mrakia frigida]|uniref:uncharacterized protein n=1 Tax=Mrakia frigida TaxID=29902 RepID=UPI003FCC20A6